MKLFWHWNFKEKWHLYEVINKNRLFSIKNLSGCTGWSIKKVSYYINRLVKEGLIRKSEVVPDMYVPKSVKELLNSRK